jgi:CheY-like chemotaxis protein
MKERRRVILCVDDENNPLVLRKLVLEKAGYEVITARSGREALEVAASLALDLVLSDHLMPGMSGAELAQHIKTSYPNLPVVLISGVNDIPPGASVADAFVSKVEGPDVLGRQIAAVLQHGKTQGERSPASC